MRRFTLSDNPLSAPTLADDGAGGFVTFEGKVRDRFEGRKVVALEYQCYEDLAVSEGESLLEDAIAKFGLLAAECAHRTGLLKVCETAVVIAVSAPHRREAFAACEWIIDELKRRVPIWKREVFESGDSGWVGMETNAESAPVTEATLFMRQVRLPEVGEEGQRKLRETSVLVVGAGGLGCGALPFLAAAGFGRIGIVDGDKVEASNLHRQVLFQHRDVGRPKAEKAAERIAAMHPFVEVTFFPTRLIDSNAAAILADFDLVLDCTDNFAAKFLLNDCCHQLGKPLVQSSIHRFEGQIHLLDPAADAGCLRCLWPEQPPDGCVGTCAEVGVLGVVPGVFGAMQANEAVKWALGLPTLSASILTLDLRDYATRRFPRPKAPECPTCGTGALRDQNYEVDWAEAERLLESGGILVDIRETFEQRPLPINRQALHAPLSQFPAAFPNPEDGPLVLICRSGARSGVLAWELTQRGWKAYSVRGGAMEATR